MSTILVGYVANDTISTSLIDCTNDLPIYLLFSTLYLLSFQVSYLSVQWGHIGLYNKVSPPSLASKSNNYYQLGVMNRPNIKQNNPLIWEAQQLAPQIKPPESKMEGLVEMLHGHETYKL